MRAISLTQPWATLVAIGAKRIETRSWSTRYRGPLAIHAAKGFPRVAREFAILERTLGRLPVRVPLGAIVATARLVNVVPTDEIVLTISTLEWRYGDYASGRFAWILEDVKAMAEPVLARGALGLWEWAAREGDEAE